MCVSSWSFDEPFGLGDSETLADAGGFLLPGWGQYKSTPLAVRGASDVAINVDTGKQVWRYCSAHRRGMPLHNRLDARAPSPACLARHPSRRERRRGLVRSLD